MISIGPFIFRDLTYRQRQEMISKRAACVSERRPVLSAGIGNLVQESVHTMLGGS